MSERTVKRKGIKRFIEKLFGDELEIQHKLLNLILLAAFLGGIVSLFASIGIGIGMSANVSIATLIVVVGLGLWIANKKGKPQIAALLIVVVANMILFPIMYFTGGGMMSGMPVWLVLGMIFSWLILRGRLCFIMYSLNVLAVVGCMVWELKYPEAIVPLESRNAAFVDMIQSIIVVTCIFGAIFKYQTHVYEKQKAQLIKANSAKSDFLANMSHEVRTPIHAILGYNEMILKESKESHTVEYAMNVQNAGKNLLSLVSNILDYIDNEKGGPAEEFVGEIAGGGHEPETMENLPGHAADVVFEAPGARILAVDDNLTNLDLLKGILRRAMMQPDVAMNGAEALELMRKKEYHLILMDHMMPVMDGVEALKQMRKEHLCESATIIVLTANAVGDARERYLAEGFDDYLAKPIRGNQLLETVKRYMPQEAFAGKEESLLDRLTFLDTGLGMQYCCDNEDFYREMLTSYLTNQKKDALQEKFNAEKWDEYRILVHALKSTSLSVGASSLSEEAKALENAVKENRTDYVKENHGMVMEHYGELLDALKGALEGATAVAESRVEETEEQEHILVVDDEIMNLKIAERLLGGAFRVTCVASGREALEFLRENKSNLVLLDLHMPEMDGFEVIRRMKASPGLGEVPVVFLTADNDRETEIRGFREGALDFITKPFVADIMLQRIKRILELDRLQKNLQQEVGRQTRNAEARREKVERLSMQIMLTLANTIDAKDKYTNGHSVRVAEYAGKIAARMGKSRQEQEDIYYIGLLHDIGKIGIPNTIINKTEALTDEEYVVVKKHPQIGAEILENMTEIPGLPIGAHWHHERYDGTGYPEGLKGEEIPEIARIIGVADAYDAMASKRSYRDVLPQSTIKEELIKGKGKQFDPYLVDIMLELIEEDKNYQMRERT